MRNGARGKRTQLERAAQVIPFNRPTPLGLVIPEGVRQTLQPSIAYFVSVYMHSQLPVLIGFPIPQARGIYIYVYRCVCVCIYIYIYICVCVCVCVCMYVYIYIYM